jgi:integrase/recombinase XerD
MKRARQNDLGLSVEKFFREYLPTLRGMSLHTIRSYRDALVLFLRFVASHGGRRLEDRGLDIMTAEYVTLFLTFLEVERRNSIATRNARLAGLHTFARFLASESPEHLAELQRVLGLPFKRGARNAPIEYLESAEVEAFLGQIDRSTAMGRRDYALFALLLNTGLASRRYSISNWAMCEPNRHTKFDCEAKAGRYGFAQYGPRPLNDCKNWHSRQRTIVRTTRYCL